MLKIDTDLLAEVGLEEMPTWERDLLLAYIYETLEMRVGIKLADRFNDEELDEFEVFFEQKDEHGAFEWLQQKAPDYKEIVAAEFETLKKEMSNEVPSILKMSRVTPPVDNTVPGNGEALKEVAEPPRAGPRPSGREVRGRGRR
jgi:hypothetical protein